MTALAFFMVVFGFEVWWILRWSSYGQTYAHFREHLNVR
jgi:hypothetical protein